jgi:HK97 family phage major capsid protein
MSTVNNALDQAELIVEIKAIEKNIVGKFDEIQKATDQANAELKALGEVKIETKAQLEALAKQYDELYNRVQVVEQKGAITTQQSDAYDLGEDFIKCDAFQAMKAGTTGRARLEVAQFVGKTAIINATGQSQPLVQSDRDMSGIYTTPNRNLRIRDMIRSRPTNSNLIEFTRENAFTNNAGPTVSGSPQQFENVTKPESANTFTLVNVPVVTLAHFIPASVQVLDDSPMLASHINGRLMYGLKLKEETQMVTGTGANGQLNGLYTQATAYTIASPTRTNEIDILRDAIKQAQVAEYMPDFIVLNPIDWFDIEIRKVGTGDARYVVGDPNNMRPMSLWGLPVIVTNSITSGTFLIGSSMAAEIADRQQAVVEASREDSTNFQKNMVTIRAEERLALCVFRTEAFIKGSI